MPVRKSFQEINEKIKQGKAVVLTAEEVSAMGRELSPAQVAEKVDVVTTATFGPMCSSGMFINTGHSNPPMRMEKATLNGVPVFTGIAAVDLYIGATENHPERPEYGGAHIIEELIDGKDIELVAHAKGTDCYPRKDIRTTINRDNINEMMISLPDPPLEISEKHIRAKDGQQIPKRVSPEHLPKLLFTCLRPKALHIILEKGILPMGRKHVILSSDKKMAKRIGRRIHASPALLTVSVDTAIKLGTLFLQTGETLFLARSIPVGCFTTPQLPKEPRVAKHKEPPKPKGRDRFPGSFFPDITEQVETIEPKKMTRKQRREKDIDWKKSRKQTRRR